MRGLCAEEQMKSATAYDDATREKHRLWRSDVLHILFDTEVHLPPPPNAKVNPRVPTVDMIYQTHPAAHVGLNRLLGTDLPLALAQFTKLIERLEVSDCRSHGFVRFLRFQGISQLEHAHDN